MKTKKEVNRAIRKILVIAFFLSVFASLLTTTLATQSEISGNASLTIWTNGTPSGENRTLGGGLSGKTQNDYNFFFLANFTNITGAILNSTDDNGNCTIIFNETGIPTTSAPLIYSQEGIWTYNRSFNYKGNLSFLVTCTSDYGNITNLTDSFYVLNTGPYLSTISSITFENEEDNFSTNNFSQYIREDDFNDVLTYSIMNITSTKHTETEASYYQAWLWINASNGLIYVNATNDTQAADYGVTIRVLDDGNDGQDIAGLIKTVSVKVNPENDPPYFVNLEDGNVINKSGIELILTAADEEWDTPYIFNVTFQTCTHTSLDPPTGPDNCTLFNLTYYNSTATNISVIPNGRQRGEYEINFTVKDARNGTRSVIVNWTVSWNDAPSFAYVCDNERNATEDSDFICFINVTDPDESHNFTFIANYTWLTFNGTSSNLTVIPTSTGNASAMLNFTPSDLEVGNWSVNLTVIDTGAPNATIELNSTQFYLFIGNINDSVSISDIADMTAYTSSTYNLVANATDNDLLVTQKNIKNETLTFYTNNSDVSITNLEYISGTNRAEATISFDPNDLGTGNHAINVTVQDRGNASTSSDIFTINVIDNTAPVWNESTITNLTYTEGEELYLNLSQNVTDTDQLNFTLIELTDYVDCFDISIDRDTGVINFTLTDNDVGFYRIRVTADDGKTPSSLDFNITVNNVNDLPSFYGIPAYPNMSYSSGRINLTEDNYTKIYFQIVDEDLKICSDQSEFYSESFTYSLNITGPNETLFAFETEQQVGTSPPRYQFVSYRFAPQKKDIGNYNVTFNVTDFAGASSFSEFNLTVFETLHAPVITDISNAELSILNESFYTDANASDEEDGPDALDGNLTFRLENLTAGGNFLKVNSSTGIINFTTNRSLAGKWEFLIIVNDTHGSEASDYFNISIYDYPDILLPSEFYNFSLTENITSFLNFTVNHTVQDQLNYQLILKGEIKNSTQGYGNGSEFLLAYTPNFTMETTCSGMINLTLNVSNPKLSNSTTWLVEINHTDYPLRLLGNIPDQDGGSPLNLQLKNYFQDFDASDNCRNQTIGFVYSLVENSTIGGDISVTITNWSGNGTNPLSIFSAQVGSTANYSFTAIEYNLSNTSQPISSLETNNFSVSLTVTQGSPQQVQTSSGGGGSTRTQLISLKIIVPEPVSAKQKDKLIIPLGLENDGRVDLEGILLSATVAKDGTLRNDFVATFSQSFFEELEAGQKEDTTLIVDIDTESTGLFEVTINATVEDPEYSDWAKFYIEIDPDKDVLERIIFTEEFVFSNPDCFELQDLLNEAKALVESDPDEALRIAEDVLDSCRELITQPPRPRISQVLSSNVFIGYTAIASLIAFVAGFIYYTYKKVSLKRKIKKDLGNI